MGHKLFKTAEYMIQPEYDSLSTYLKMYIPPVSYIVFFASSYNQQDRTGVQITKSNFIYWFPQCRSPGKLLWQIGQIDWGSVGASAVCNYCLTLGSFLPNGLIATHFPDLALPSFNDHL